MNFQKLDRWHKGDTDSAAQRNQPVDVINEAFPFVGGPGIAVTGSPCGTVVHALPDQRRIREWRFGAIVSRGPRGESDYSDSRYFVNFGTLAGTTHGAKLDNEAIDLWSEQTDGSGNVSEYAIVTATNLAESADQTHGLPTDGSLIVQVVKTTDGDGNPHWFFVTGGSGGVDIYQGTTSVLARTPFINMSTSRATTSIMEFVPESISGTNGVGLRLKAAASNYMVPQYVGGNWVLDWVRAH